MHPLLSYRTMNNLSLRSPTNNLSLASLHPCWAIELWTTCVHLHPLMSYWTMFTCIPCWAIKPWTTCVHCIPRWAIEPWTTCVHLHPLLSYWICCWVIKLRTNFCKGKYCQRGPQIFLGQIGSKRNGESHWSLGNSPQNNSDTPYCFLKIWASKGNSRAQFPLKKLF